MKLTVTFIIGWLIVLTYLVCNESQTNEERIARQVATQLTDRERKLVGRYADRLVVIQREMGVVNPKKPQTIQDVVDIIAHVSTSMNPSSMD